MSSMDAATDSDWDEGPSDQSDAEEESQVSGTLGMAAFCECGNRFLDDDLFCGMCGAKRLHEDDSCYALPSEATTTASEFEDMEASDAEEAQAADDFRVTVSVMDSSSAATETILSVRKPKACRICQAPYTGFGDVCSTCRKSPNGKAKQCRVCSHFFSGFGDICEDCVA